MIEDNNNSFLNSKPTTVVPTVFGNFLKNSSSGSKISPISASNNSESSNIFNNSLTTNNTASSNMSTINPFNPSSQLNTSISSDNSFFGQQPKPNSDSFCFVNSPSNMQNNIAFNNDFSTSKSSQSFGNINSFQNGTFNQPFQGVSNSFGVFQPVSSGSVANTSGGMFNMGATSSTRNTQINRPSARRQAFRHKTNIRGNK